MSDLISRDALRMQFAKECHGECDVCVERCQESGECMLVLAAPAVDAVHVVHGQWLDCENYNDIRQCSECGLIRNIYKQEGWNYCPNCGAKMDGGADDV